MIRTIRLPGASILTFHIQVPGQPPIAIHLRPQAHTRKTRLYAEFPPNVHCSVNFQPVEAPRSAERTDILEDDEPEEDTEEALR